MCLLVTARLSVCGEHSRHPDAITWSEEVKRAGMGEVEKAAPEDLPTTFAQNAHAPGWYMLTAEVLDGKPLGAPWTVPARTLLAGC